MKSKLKAIQNDFSREAKATASAADVQALVDHYLSRRGVIAELSKEMKTLPEQERKEIGRLFNDVRVVIQTTIERLQQQYATAATSSAFDPTLPGTRLDSGHLHPMTQALRELEDIFTSLGFMILDGPELESEWYAFEALNIPRTHPARDMQDTFFIDQQSVKSVTSRSRLAMRPHTSSVQVRAMQDYGAPLRVISLGKVFRNEATDMNHEHTFHQIEGLMVDEHISIAHLIKVLKDMLTQFYGEEITLRLRPGYFPFVEPGFEIDIATKLKKSGWMEMLGAGMVHPNVLRAGGIDPKKYAGFAFGTGVERLVMLKHGIPEIRLFHSGDLHFLKQF